MLICTAASPTVAGAMRVPIRRSPGSPGAHSGRKRHPRPRRPGIWIANCVAPPSSVPMAHPRATCSRGSPSHESATPQRIATTLNIAGAKRRKAEALLGVQHPHGDGREGDERQERQHDARQAHRQLGLARHRVEAGRQEGHEGPGAGDARQDDEPQDHRQEREEARGQAMGRGGSLLRQGARVGRHEGRRQRSLGEQVAQQVRDPEGDLEGVGVEAGPEERGEDLLADDAQQPRQQRQGRDEPGRSDGRRGPRTAPLRDRRLRVLDRGGHSLLNCPFVVGCGAPVGRRDASGRSGVAHHASALKQMRQGVKHNLRNRKNVSLVHGQIKKLRDAIAKGDGDAAKKLLPETVGAIDKAAKKGVIHDNAAARYKSRLTRKVTLSPPPASPFTRPARLHHGRRENDPGLGSRLQQPVGASEGRHRPSKVGLGPQAHGRQDVVDLEWGDPEPRRHLLAPPSRRRRWPAPPAPAAAPGRGRPG